MDIGAYAQIETLSELVKVNGISVPRLRGYRLMSDEKSIDLKSYTEGLDADCVTDLDEV